MSKYLVVEFDLNEVAVISDKWLTKGTDGSLKALWPPIKSSAKLISATKDDMEPEDTWLSCDIIRFMYTTDSFQKAQQKGKEAEDESDLLTDADSSTRNVPKKRKHRPNPRFKDSESESDSEMDVMYPKPPQKLQITQRISDVTPRSEEVDSLPASSKSVGFTKSAVHQNVVTTRTTDKSCTPVHTKQSETGGTPQRVNLNRSTSSDADIRLSQVSPRPSSTLERTTNVLSNRDILILRTLEEIKQGQTEAKQELREIKGMLAGLLQRLNSEGKAAASAPDGVNLPISTNEELREVEDILQESTSMKMMVGFFANIGGSSIKMMTRRILKETLKSSLAANYNWTGAKNKMAFGSLNLCSAVQRAVKKNFPQSSANETEFVIKDWLRNASDRDGGRKKRMKNNDHQLEQLPSSQNE